ncbi:insulinase family protein [Aceticella autotrophica]|uniref:Insulinase family protein n=1 Tax=Aceticella autotrophica TaxID=2755338 RepID=A0A975AWZ2_9THEO|nr:pitrilysin family protein [Aceticella autotrophica]QSZ27913.1 insulinase family protein [Aceticella autotrophica]
MDLIHVQITDGINLYVKNIDKFKTISINTYIHNYLGKDATRFALIPSILRRGTKKIKTYKDISKFLEGLYGATLSSAVYKRGERHIQQYKLELAEEKYINEDILNVGANFLKEFLFNPLIVDNGFEKAYVNQEKEIQKNRIESRINEKTKYAVDRCIEEMCKGENYSIYELGSIEDLNEIDEKNLYRYYCKCMNTLPIDIYVVGHVDPDYVIQLFHKHFNVEREKILSIPETAVKKSVEKVKYVTDKLDVTQGKLTLGFRTNISPNEKAYYPLLLYSGILGGGPFSKLFMNVREKSSLAYYASTRLERFKGLMLIMSGIEIDNYQKTLDLILQQVEEMKRGNISNYEFDSTLKAVRTSMNAIKDSATQLSDFYMSQNIAHSNDDIEDFINKIEKVAINDVVRVSENIKLDTVYFMTGRKGGVANAGNMQ